MKSFAPLNPFARLTQTALAHVLDDVRTKAQAEARLRKLLTAYEELVQDPRYSPIKDELKLVLGDYLRELVECARKCPRCAPKAEPIRVFQEFIAEPLQEVWFARQQEEAAEARHEEVGDEELVGGNGSD